MIDINKPRKQLAKDVLEGHQNNGQFFSLQSKDTLMAISQAMQIEAMLQTDFSLKELKHKLSEMAKKRIQYNQNKERFKRDAFTFHLTLKKGAKDINFSQVILILFTTLIVGFIGYYNNNQRQDWLTITIGVCIVSFTTSFIGIVIYNCCCISRIERTTIEVIEEENQIFLNPSMRNK